MHRHILSLLLVITSILPLSGRDYPYGTPSEPWEESFGNHRAVINVPRSAESAELVFNWRRHGNGVADHRFIIVEASTGKQVPNILRKRVDNEECDIVFGPVKEGTYHFYYLPYNVQFGCGLCLCDYLKPEEAPDPKWVANLPKPVSARIARVESRTTFDSFYPMELPATAAEVRKYLSSQKADLYLFPEDRTYPARMRDAIPSKWLATRQGDGFRGIAAPNEYYAFQACIWAPEAPLGKLEYSITDLRSAAGTIPASAVTCINLEGTDPAGRSVTFDVTVPKGTVQPLWFGVDIPENQACGIYDGTLTIRDDSGKTAVVPVSITVDGAPIKDRGDSESWRHSRLRWLNSTLGLEDIPTAPYSDVKVTGDTVSVLGRSVTLAGNGAAEQIESWDCEVLDGPVRLVIVSGGKEIPILASEVSSKLGRSSYNRIYRAENDGLEITCNVTVEFDGWIDTKYTIKAVDKIDIDDIRLEIPVSMDVAKAFMGLGLHAQEIPLEFEGGWSGPVKVIDASGKPAPIAKAQSDNPYVDDLLWPFDSFWIGRAEAGIQCELRGSSYTGPLLNVYHPAYPLSWDNGGKGGFRILNGEDDVTVVAYSGSRTLEAGASVDYEYALIVTPVKDLTPEAHFGDRYYHGAPVLPSDADIDAGVTVVNIHHATEMNPFINYPYPMAETLRGIADDLHSKGCKLKIYYTVRELSNAVPEIWAIRSLGHEIFRGGEGGGAAWLQEHLCSDYTHQWYHHFDFDVADHHPSDAAVLMAEGASRWFNYYVEGLAWLVRHADIDGIYMDDVTFGRDILKRMRRAMETVKPGCLIDLHSNTGFSKGPAIQYTEFFPYIDKVWFGEFFKYDRLSSTAFLTESSGIPFGLPGDMLQSGGNPWLGMTFGMTNRCQWNTEGVICNPRPIWKVWDEFGIEDADMAGFWEDYPVVESSDPDVKVTAFINDGCTLLAVGNFSDDEHEVTLTIDWESLGLDPAKAVLTAPEVEDFQPARTWNPGETITVAPRRGWMIYVR